MVSADIAIFARLPVLGKVKTRLASGLGPEKAVQFYKACAEHIFRECSRCVTARATVFFSSDSDLPDARKWLAATGLVRTAGVRILCAQEASWVEYALQALPCAAQAKDQDLGVRMYSALASLLAQDHTSKAIVVGTDIPDISASILEQTVSALDTYQVVIGPAVDGGYYLLGTTTASKELFEGIEWSTDTVLERTLQKANELQLQILLLPTLQDIDTMQDLEQWRHATSLKDASHPIMPVINQILQ